MPQHHIVALGSSFAAGPGIAPIIDRTAWRSGNNYAHLLAKKLDARLTDVTSSGATLLNILDQPQKHMLSSSPPQLEGLPPDATIVMLTAGGNDMGYIGGMVMDAVKASLHSVPILGELFPPDQHEQEEHLNVDQVVDRFVKVIDGIRSRAAQATIYLVEYLTVLGPDAKPGAENPLTQEQIRHHRNMAQSLAQAYQATATLRPEVKLVKMVERSQDHGVGSANPWMCGFTTSMLLGGVMSQGGWVYHPNSQGHEVMAEALYEQITADAAR